MTHQSRPGGILPRARTAVVAVAAVAFPTYLALAAAGEQPDRSATRGTATDVSPVAATVRLSGPSGGLAFSSYLGGQEWDEATGVATDGDGNTYITGFTLSSDFPVSGPAGRRHAGVVDAFVTKVSARQGRVLWSTHLGGIDMDSSNAVTTDAAGNVYVVGRTGSPDFPATVGQTRLRGRECTGEPCHDAFVTKLSGAGRVRWSTLFGGTQNEEAVSVAVDARGAVYVAGLTDSSDLPTKAAFQRTSPGAPCPGDLPCPYDAFVAKLAPGGGHLVYSTYLGGSGTDIARGIDVDRFGNAYVAGSTGSPDFPTVRAFQSGMRGAHCGPPPGEPCRQAFITKLRPRGSTAAFSTYLGGAEHDDAYAVSVDRQGHPHVTGSTQSTDFPTRRAFQRAADNSGCFSEQPTELCDDGFVTKLTVDGGGLLYSTYLGGRAEDQGLSIDLTARGGALVAGRTDSRDFHTTGRAAQPTFGGYIDGFAMRLDSGGTPLWATFLGGADADRATGIATGPSATAHVVGRTLSPRFPTKQAFQSRLKDSDYDAFITVVR